MSLADKGDETGDGDGDGDGDGGDGDDGDNSVRAHGIAGRHLCPGVPPHGVRGGTLGSRVEEGCGRGDVQVFVRWTVLAVQQRHPRVADVLQKVRDRDEVRRDAGLELSKQGRLPRLPRLPLCDPFATPLEGEGEGKSEGEGAEGTSDADADAPFIVKLVLRAKHWHAAKCFIQQH